MANGPNQSLSPSPSPSCTTCTNCTCNPKHKLRPPAGRGSTSPLEDLSYIFSCLRRLRCPRHIDLDNLAASIWLESYVHLTPLTYTFIRSRFIDQLRKDSRQAASNLDIDMLDKLTAEHNLRYLRSCLCDDSTIPDDHSDLSTTDLLNAIFARALLTIEELKVIILYVLEDKTFEEIGSTLGCAKSTALTKYRRAIDKLYSSYSKIRKGL